MQAKTATTTPTINPQLAALQASFANEFIGDPAELSAPVIKEKEPVKAKIDVEAKRKAADMTHRGTVNNQLYLKLAALGVGDELAKSIIRAAVNGELGAMIISY